MTFTVYNKIIIVLYFLFLFENILCKRPNIVFIITDDQDVELGSMKTMNKTRNIMEEGAEFIHAFVSSPICCPSRSSLLTGLYVHNHNIYTNNDNCTGEYWRQYHEKRTFATFIKNANYHTGFIGKYLNRYNADYIPPGWNYWFAQKKNTQYYNYSVSDNGKLKYYGYNEENYFTDVIKNKAINFIRKSHLRYSDIPFFTVISLPAPHGTEDAAIRHRGLFLNNTLHRTPSWNYAPNADKQWLFQNVGKMTPTYKKFTDILNTKRLQTLQSVDELVQEVYDCLNDLKILEETIIIYTSDHGYHLGQFGLLKGKTTPYEFDIKVPFYIRGPGIPKRSIFSDMMVNIDIAPTLMEIAGVDIKYRKVMDGISVWPLLKNNHMSEKLGDRNLMKVRRKWRSSILIQRGKLTKQNLSLRQQLEAHKFDIDYNERLINECEKLEYHGPCNKNRVWRCVKNEYGKFVIHKCPNHVKCVRICHNQKRNAKLASAILSSFDTIGPLNSTKKSSNFVLKNIRKLTKSIKNIEKCNCMEINKLRRYRSRRANKKIWDDEEYDGSNLNPESKSFKRWRKQKMKKAFCKQENRDCMYHDKYHWKTAPLWTDGPICFCVNGQNNTYWCQRTVNDTHNFLFCEFITGFYSYYDINKDPYQLNNIVSELEIHQLQQLVGSLDQLKSCKSSECRRIRKRNLPTLDSIKKRRRLSDSQRLDRRSWKRNRYIKNRH